MNFKSFEADEIMDSGASVWDGNVKYEALINR